MEPQRSLTNLQLELLKIFSFNLPEDELLEIKNILAQHLADRLTRRVGKIWEDKGLTQDDMDQWLNDETPFVVPPSGGSGTLLRSTA